MKTLCITGIQSNEFNQVGDLLFSSGLERANPVERQTTIGMIEWHQHTFHALKQKKKPGKLWEQLAGELILTNLQQSQWGWADIRSKDALDFWAQLEPNISFLLLTCPPQDFLAQRLLNSTGEQVEDHEVCLREWQSENEKILDFYLENSDRCLLVDACQAAAYPRALANQLKERWGVHLDMGRMQLSVPIGKIRQSPPYILASYIADKALYDYEDFDFNLKAEVEAAQYPLVESEVIAEENSSIIKKTSLVMLLKDYQKRCEEDLTDNERQEYYKLKNELKEAQSISSTGSHLQESERLILELHKVQEELECYFLQYQQKSHEVEKLNKENRKLKQQYSLAKEQASAPKGLFLRKPKKIASLLEFEGAKLRSEQVNPDYEHLWISLQSPSFGERLADQWHFRISCAGVKPGEFGKQPKLELPEQNEQLLINWFPESESEHGRKLELRFALPNAMDTKIWKQIDLDDQQLIKSLLKQLPDIVLELKSKQICIHRDWSDWEKLVADMLRINMSKR
jgi:hypothetical protein